MFPVGCLLIRQSVAVVLGPRTPESRAGITATRLAFGVVGGEQVGRGALAEEGQGVAEEALLDEAVGSKVATGGVRAN